MKKTYTKTICRRLLCIILVLCCMSTAAFAIDLPFTDVQKGSYYYDAVDWAYQNNITAGTSATEFSPNMGCTRGQVVTFLWRTAGSPKDPRITPFNDVKSDDYYRDAVAWAVWNDITAGTSATTFSPLQDCTYEQIITFIYRTVREPGAKPGVKTIADDYPDSAWYKAAIRWADSYGLLKNTSGFKLGKVCPRCDIVEYLYAYSQIDKIMDDPDKVGTVDVRVNDTLYADQAKKEGNDFYVSTTFVENVLGTTMTSNRADKLVKATDAAKVAGYMYEYADAYNTIHFLKSAVFTQSQAENLRGMDMTSESSWRARPIHGRENEWNADEWAKYKVFGYTLKEDYNKTPEQMSELVYGKKEDRLAALTSKANSYELMSAYGTTGAKAVSAAKAAVEIECSDYKLEFISDETMTWHGDGMKDIIVVRGYLKLTPFILKSDWSRENNTIFVSLLGSTSVNQRYVSYIPVDLFAFSFGSLVQINVLGNHICPDLGGSLL